MHPIADDPTVAEIIEHLSRYAPDTPVRLAINPAFPYAHKLGDIVLDVGHDGCPVVFLGESGQAGFLPAMAAQELGWHPRTTVPARVRRGVGGAIR
ncbi:hypothetical protein OTB20_36100 [Streptomyces sp. H27-H1]|uniref:hypothetical protein n=1 Tax=Streptomyces sp. H27-H1 TaxID=2996461 RepID=UPI00226F3911|nr:hypothetical protein [Streptomyces sp. H27-H1]MCY0931515.1 hypothetical protein [Streptomyces sp. H27-H1]